MPLYEYQCDACAHRFEAIQKYSDAPIETCPKCNGGVKKLLSSPAIQFMGSGWYITDYARAGKSDKSDSGQGSSSSPSSESKAEVKSDSKSETKTETKSESSSDSKPSTPSSSS